MQRVGLIKDSFLAFGNLHAAYKKAFKGTKNPQAYDFAFHLEAELFTLQNELQSEQYLPGSYRYYTIYKPKERLISVAPFRDRVVHHALVQVLEPIFEKRFLAASYANRKGKGTHRAIARAQQYLRQKRYYLKLDIQKYFDSIDHNILRAIIRRTIKDQFILRLCDRIIEQGGDGKKGLPIGNLTSQFFANVYLNAFDHYVQEELRVKAYVRYMDDFVLFSNDPAGLRALRAGLEAYLADKLALKVKSTGTLLNTRLHGLPFLGVRIFPALIRMGRKNFKRSLSKLKTRQWQYARGSISYEQYSCSMQSLLAHLNHWGNHLLKKQMS